MAIATFERLAAIRDAPETEPKRPPRSKPAKTRNSKTGVPPDEDDAGS